MLWTVAFPPCSHGSSHQHGWKGQIAETLAPNQSGHLVPEEDDEAAEVPTKLYEQIGRLQMESE